MISFKQFLAEKAMNKTEFAKTLSRQGDKAKVGFEFEMVIPTHSGLHGDAKDNRDYEWLRNINTYEEIVEYFDLGRADRAQLSNEYEDWQSDRKAEWIDDHADEFMDDDEVEEHGEKHALAMAQERAADEYDRDHSNDATFGEFIYDTASTVYSFIRDHGYEPKYGWESDSGNDSSRVYIEELADSGDEKQQEVFTAIENDLTDFIGANVTTPWKDAKVHFDSGDWLVMPDGSIKPGENGGVGAEVVSPPDPLNKALKNLETMFKWMKANHAETNETTGLHINISMPGLENVDLVKLVMFMGEKHVLQQFDRLHNTYTRPQLQNIINNLSGVGKLPRSAKPMIDLAKAALSQHKYSAVNISKLSSGYLEFRIAGDEDYHKKYDLIKDTVLRFVSALEVAIDPDAYKQEYLKKLSKALGVAEESENNNDYENRPLRDLLELGDMEPVARIMDSFIADAKAGRGTSESWRDRAYSWVEGPLMSGYFKAFSELGIKKLSNRQKAEFKLLAKRLGVDTEKLRNEPADPWKRHVLDMLGLEK